MTKKNEITKSETKIPKKDLIKIDGKTYKKEAFIIEDEHPVIGRILIVEGMKFKILDYAHRGTGLIAGHRTGTFLAKLTELDEERMAEYDKDLEELSEKLVTKLDLKRMIKENIKNKCHQEIKTGLFILKCQEDGEEVEEEHLKGCYQFVMHYKNNAFAFTTGSDVVEPLE